MIIVFTGVFALDDIDVQVEAFQTATAAFGIGFTAITPSGICTRSLTVGEPAQPWGTANTAL